MSIRSAPLPPGLDSSELPRNCRRLHFLRGWTHDRTRQIFTRGKGAGGSDGLRARERMAFGITFHGVRRGERWAWLALFPAVCIVLADLFRASFFIRAPERWLILVLTLPFIIAMLAPVREFFAKRQSSVRIPPRPWEKTHLDGYRLLRHTLIANTAPTGSRRQARCFRRSEDL